MSSPPVSIILTTFNSERYLEQAVESLLHQTYERCEILAVDNQSRDRTLEILKRYADRGVRVHVVEQPCDLATARNTGMRLTQGELIAFMDDDDVWYPQKIQKQVEFFAAHPTIPLCHTRCEIIDGQGQVQYQRHEGVLPGTGYIFHQLLRHNYVTISTVMVRRDFLQREGIEFPAGPDKVPTGEDNIFMLRVAARRDIGLVDGVLSQYRRYGSSACNRLGWKFMPENVPLQRLLLDRPRYWEGVVSRREVVEALVDACVENSQYWRDHGCAERSLWFAWVGWKVAPWSTALIRELGKSMLSLSLRSKEMRRRKISHGVGGGA